MPGSTSKVTGAASPSSPGLPVTTTLKPGVVSVHLKLFFWEPEKAARRPFPKGVKVLVKGKPYTVGDEGYLVFPADKKFLGKWSFTLEFASAGSQYVVCEPLPASPPAGSPPSGSPPKYPLLASNPPDTGERYFLLPMDDSHGHWQLRNSDWEMTQANNVKFDAAKGTLEHQDKKKPIGSATAPVELTLDPHWKYFAFEFFDRYYGHTGHGDKRVTAPPLPLAGFYNDKAASGQADTRSNWTVPDGQNLVQCLPFIRRRDNSGKSLITGLDNAHLGLRFQFAESRYVYSESATSRKIEKIPGTDNRLKPGPDRLKYYDLPLAWKSRRYFTRWPGAPAPGGKFFNELPKAQIDDADTKAKALRFCLDDIVLFEADGANLKPLANWAASDRVAVFNHRFNDTVGATPTKNGVYKVADPVGDAANVYPLPFSKVDVTRSPSSGPKNTYIFDYPDWTRLIATQGSLFDVFDWRAPDHADPERVVGARAAVRWIDATAPLSGVVTQEWNWVTPPSVLVPAGVAGWVTAAGPHNPVGGAKLSSAGAIEKRPVADSLFALQACHFQNCTEFPMKYDEAKTTRFGRFDMLLLRCCDVDNGEEVATNLHYIRTYYHNLAATVGAAGAQRRWCHDISVNVSGRWNGDDALNDCRAVMVPDQSPAAPLRVQVVWFDQSLEQSRATWKLTLTPAGGTGRSNRGSEDGTGETRADQQATEGASGWFTSAHESGHMNGFPDDYNERWNCASYDQISFRANGPPGDPYEPDGRQDATVTYGGTILNGSMMNVNSRVRGRYYWPSAEWVSRIIGFPLKVKFTDTLDSTEYEYKLPPHPKRDADRTYLSWPFIGMRNATTGAAPPATSPPSVGVVNWDRFECYLYALGKDHYSQEGLQQLAVAARSDRGRPALATPPTFDGMLVVNVRLKCTLPGDATVGTEDTDRADLVAKIAAAVRKGMCNRWSMKGSFGSPPHLFERCLINIVPLIMVENDPHGHYAAKGWSPADLETEYGVHFLLEAKESAASPPVAASVWDIPNRKLNVDFRPGQAVDLGTQLEDKFPGFLGIDKTMAAVTANDIKKIVDLMGGAGVTVEEIS